MTGIVYGACNTLKCEQKFILKILTYQKRYSDDNNPTDVEVNILRELSNLVKTNRTPHICMYYYDFNCSLRLQSCLDNKFFNPNGINFQQALNARDFHDKIKFLVAEYVTGGDLKNYIRKNKMNDDLLRNMVFQMIYTLAVTQRHYEGFRHNDLHAGNVLVDDSIPDRGYYVYKFDDNSFNLPNAGARLKMWDFDLSVIPNQIENAKVRHRRRDGISKDKNPVYDLHFFLSAIYAELVRKNKLNQVPEFNTFFTSVIPEKYREGGSDEYLSSGRLAHLSNNYYPDDILTPEELLKNDYFKVYKTETPEGPLWGEYNGTSNSPAGQSGQGRRHYKINY